MDTDRLFNGKDALEEWGAQASVPAPHITAKRSFCRLGWDSQLTTLFLMASVAAVFVTIRCFRQLSTVNIHRKGPLRSLAEGEGTWGSTPCLGADLENNQRPAGAEYGIELAILQRTAGVVRRLIQVTKDCASVAFLLPPPLPMRVVDLFLGFCIQEVAALSTLLGRQFEEQKAEVLQIAVKAALDAKYFCRQRTTRAQQQHASRLVRYALDLWAADPETAPLASELRLRMLEELLELQETALTLIETAVLLVLKPQHSQTQVTAERAHELSEELKRVIYTRRSQVFKSKHLSHYLRGVEGKLNRGRLVDLLSIQKLDEKPEQSLEQQVADLIDGGAWVRKPLEETRRYFLDTYIQGERNPGKKSEDHAVPSTANEGVEISRKRPGTSLEKFKLPPRFQGIERSFDLGDRMKCTQERLAKADTSLPEHSQGTPCGFSPSYGAQSIQLSQTHQYEAPATAPPSGEPLTELGAAPSSPLDTRLRWPSLPSSSPAASSSPAPRAQPGEPAVAEILEASSGSQAQTRFDADAEASWSPWSSTWPPRSPDSPIFPTPYLTPSTIAGLADAIEGTHVYDRSQRTASQQWRVVSPAVPPPPSFFFTTPQAIALGARQMLDSLRSQAPPAEMLSIAHSHPGPTFGVPSSFTLSSQTREPTIWSADIFSSSEQEGRRRFFRSVGQGMAQGEERRPVLSGPSSAVSSIVQVLGQEVNEGALGESGWLNSDSDSGWLGE